MTPSNIWPVGPHAFAEQAYMAQACWQRVPLSEALREEAMWNEYQTLVVSVPAFVQEDFFVSLWDGRRRSKATMFQVGNSGVAVLSIVAGRNAVVTAIDLAGHPRAPELGHAACQGSTFTVLVSHEEDEIRPLLPIDGLAAAIEQARQMPRLAGRDFREGVRKLRAALESPMLFEILGIAPQHLNTLTVAVCQPMPG